MGSRSQEAAVFPLARLGKERSIPRNRLMRPPTSHRLSVPVSTR